MVDPRSKVISYVFGEAPELQEQYPRTTEVLTTPIAQQPTSIITAPESPRTKVISYVTERVPLEQYPKTYETLTSPVGPSGRPEYTPRVGYRPTTYTTIYSNYNENITAIDSNIEYIRNLPPNTMLQTESGTMISRNQAITLLTRQRNTLIRDREQIISYEQKGYVIQKDNEGNIVFRKLVEQPTILEQAQTEYQSLSPLAQVFRAVVAGVTQFPTLIYNVNPPNWFINYITKGYEQGTIDIFNIMRNTQKDIILGENKIYEAGKTGNILFTVKELVTTPTFTDIVIPYGVGKVLGPAFRTIGGIGAKTIPVTGKGAGVVQKVAGVYPYVAGGVFTGLAAGGVTATLAYEQHGLVPPGSTIKQILRTGVQFGFAYQGAISNKRIIESPFKTEAITKEYPELGVNIAYTEKYINLFGKQIYYGKPQYFGAKPIDISSSMKTGPIWETPPSWTPSTGISPTSIYTVKPVGKPSVVPVFFKGKTTFITGADVGWQPKTDTSMIVKPSTSITKPFEPITIQEIIKWQPSTGIAKHPSEIKTIDELFKVYQKGKLTTDEYQYYRDIIKTKEVNITEKISPLGKPVFKPKLPVSKVEPISVKARDGLIVSEWYGKVHVETGEGWQPKTTISKALSTKVLPKPIIRGSLQTHFFVLVYEPPPVITIEPKIISVKPKAKTVKDIITSDKDIIKQYGGGQVQKGGTQKTITLQKTKTITEQLVKPVVKTTKDVITSPLSKEIIVPEELLKPVQTRKAEPLSDLLKSKQFQEYKPTKVLSKEETIRLIGVLPVQVQKKQVIQVRGIKQKKELLKGKDILSVLTTNQIQRQIKDVGFVKDTINRTVKIYDYDFYKPIIPITPIPPPPIFKKPPPPPPEEYKPPPPKPFGIDLEAPSKKTSTGRVRSFHVLIKPYMDMPYQQATLSPLSRSDALNFAHTLVGGHKQASFKLEPSSSKPSKPMGKQEKYQSNQYYYNKKKDIIVEKNKYRINSPGELAEITMKGIEARTKGVRMKGLII